MQNFFLLHFLHRYIFFDTVLSILTLILFREVHKTPDKKFLINSELESHYVFSKALYIGKLSLPADVIEISWLFLFMVELMAQNTSKSISKIFLSLVFHDIKLKLVSNCFFVSIKRYTKEKLSLIKE